MRRHFQTGNLPVEKVRRYLEPGPVVVVPLLMCDRLPIEVNCMDDLLLRFWQDLIGRLEGPLTFRLVLQPVIAMFFAIRDGRRDAVEKRVPYFWAIFTDPSHRTELLREGWKAVAKVFVMAVIIDIIYQIIVFRWIYPMQALIVAFSLAFLPYLLLRGPINRILRWL